LEVAFAAVFCRGIPVRAKRKSHTAWNVTDPTGGVVPQAVITVTEVATNIDHQVTTDANGNYEVPELKPGTYRVKADRTGFKTFIAGSVLLDVGQVRRVDVPLQVGATADTITVEAGAALITTDSGTIGGDLDTRKKYPDTPLVDIYPSPLALLTTTPGIQGNGWNVVMGGISDRNKQTWAMDGIANDTTGDQNDNPNFFEVVQVTTVNGTADNARAADFNMVSRHGSNSFHGGAYYKHENAALNARNFFDPGKTPYIFHEWEVEASGRIIKNRTFFFLGWMHQSIPLGSYRLTSMPTLLMRDGNFSQFSTVLRDPTNGQPFPDKIIPKSRFSSVATAVQNLYIPPPNTGGPNALSINLGWVFPYNSDLYKGDWPFLRFDHKLTQKNDIYVRWMKRLTPYVTPGPTPLLFNTSARDHRQLAVSDTHLFSNTLINTFTFGHQTDFQHAGEEEKGVSPLAGDDVVKAIGLQGVNPQGYHTEGFPQMTISGITTLSMNNGALNNISNDSGINTFEDTLTWNKGRHVIKAGAEYRHFYNCCGTISTQVYGNFSFNGTYTGLGYGDFLLGIPFNSTRLSPLVNRLNHQNQSGLFITDTFKISQRLTLDYGLRWDYYGAPISNDGLMYNFNPDNGDLIVAQGTLSKVHPLFPKTIHVVEGKVVGDPDKNNFRPRISVAYRLSDKFVLRGGYGEFTETYSYFSRLLNTGPYQLAESYTNVLTNGVPLFTFPNPFPSSLAAATVPGQGVTGYPLKTNNGVIRQYNFTIEREMHGVGLRASYIGSRGAGFNYNLNIDKPQPSTTPFSAARNPYPQYNSVSVTRTDGLWHYDSLQLQAQKRMGSFTFDTSWTWANNMNNYSITENPYALGRWQRDGADRRQYIVASGTWAVPVGKGRRFMSSAPAAVDRVLGGWNLQAISTFASGGYFSPGFSGTNPSNTNTSGGLPDRIADGNLSGDNRNFRQWFDPTAFAIPQPGHFGNSGGNILVGQGINVQHLSIAKTFPIFEQLRMTFTGQLANLFNHPHFNNPNSTINNPNPGLFTSQIAQYNPEKQGARQIALKIRLEW
jgi:Carboxypeptidase regulatory-like domain/TonB dependent receptor